MPACSSSRPIEAKRIQRTGRRAEMLAGKVEVDGRLFEITVSEQQLYRAQVCACLQQVRRETMAKGVRVDAAC